MLAMAALLGGALAGCKTAPNQAPVEDRPGRPSAPRVAAPAADVPRPPAPAAAAPAPDTRAGTYVVKPGDTLIRIGLDNGQSWRDIARWNGIENPNLIEVGQTLRISSPVSSGVAEAAGTTRPLPPSTVVARPLEAKPAGAVAASGSAAAPSAAPAGSSAPAPAPAPAAPRSADEDLPWAWPANGTVTSPFDEVKSKGIGISGKAGDPVVSAADGRVIYAGSGMRGYGNLVIIKHNATYLTAYAHNQTLLVKEEQVVKRGQKIAEMGATDTDHVQLHFEIRRQGKAVDPAKLLPAR